MVRGISNFLLSQVISRIMCLWLWLINKVNAFDQTSARLTITFGFNCLPISGLSAIIVNSALMNGLKFKPYLCWIFFLLVPTHISVGKRFMSKFQMGFMRFFEIEGHFLK